MPKDSPHFDTLTYAEQLYDAVLPELAFSANDLPGARIWQRRLRRKLTSLMGGFPPKCGSAKGGRRVQLECLTGGNGWTPEKSLQLSKGRGLFVRHSGLAGALRRHT